MTSWIAAAGMATGLLLQDPSLLTRVMPPSIPPQAVSGGEVLLEVSLGPSGEVAGIAVLRDTPPFTPPLRDAVTGWRFRPRASLIVPGGRVLVAGSFRPPALLESGPLRSPPADLRSSPAVPVPIRWVRAAYPPNALGNAVVILQASVGADGSVGEVTAVYSVPPFTSAAADAARQWKFRPAAVDGVPVATVAYLVFGFRPPTIPPTRR